MSELNRTYDPSREDEIYARWQEKGYFRAKPNPDKKPYTIMIPPPNITDKLHVGHALNNTIQDILIRTKRMQGYEALWLPGTDHAAISTEVQVVKAMAKEGITKDDLGRDKFLDRVWDWKKEYGGTIVKQLKKLGSSCDWERERFTMDEGLSDAVLEAFIRLNAEGKIYRGERLINWCVKCQTTISDAEVEHEDGEGKLYHFMYPILDGLAESGLFISFATTRPETMLGDMAIAVHPEDERYRELIGKYAIVPTIGRKIPIIADSYVDPTFGTGAVKITPAHDPNDWEIGQRHKLPIVNIMNDDGTINTAGGTYAGLPREDARKKIIEDMTARGLYIKTETITHAKGTHDRCKVIVEPLVKLQWFLKMDELAKPALEAYTTGKLKFNKERHGKVYEHWLNIIKDWCISRQIWWGHRIPAYYCPDGHITVAKTAPEACATCGSTSLTQDEDTLDTWFSSALWPFSTLGWPKKTPELDYFYPTNVLVTDKGIIFFWVVRMMFMGYKFMDNMPFTHVYINGTVLDENGIKMSKSLGNGIDPLEVIEKYGADVLRLTFASNSPENDCRFHMDRVEFSRNFMNKLWNATRFVLMNIDEPVIMPTPEAGQADALQTEDRWILSRINDLTQEITTKIDSHDIGHATQKIVDFIWDEFCDWYVEMVKPRLYGKTQETPQSTSANPNDDTKGGAQKHTNVTSNDASRRAAQHTLCTVLMQALKLLHPMTPFITEDLYLAIQEKAFSPAQTKDETIMLSPWPTYNEAQANPAAEKAIESIKEAVRAIRNIRAEKQVPPSQKINVTVQPTDATAEALFTESKHILAFLANAQAVDISTSNNKGNASDVQATEDVDKGHTQGQTATNRDIVFAAISNANIYVPLDVDIDKEKARLTKELKKLQQEVARVEGKLNNQGFMAKAPENLIAEEREKLEKFTAMLAKVQAEFSAL